MVYPTSFLFQAWWEEAIAPRNYLCLGELVKQLLYVADSAIEGISTFLVEMIVTLNLEILGWKI